VTIPAKLGCTRYLERKKHILSNNRALRPKYQSGEVTMGTREYVSSILADLADEAAAPSRV